MGEASTAQRDQWEEDLGIEKSPEAGPPPSFKHRLPFTLPVRVLTRVVCFIDEQEAVRLEASLVGPASTTHRPTAAQAGRKGTGAGVSECAGGGGGGGGGTGVKRKGSKAGGGGGKAKKTKTKA